MSGRTIEFSGRISVDWFEILYSLPLGKSVKSAREKHGLSLYELGKKIGECKQFVADMERGRSVKLTKERVEKICRALEIDEELFVMRAILMKSHSKVKCAELFAELIAYREKYGRIEA